jgi:transposase
MTERRRQYTSEFKQEAVRLSAERGRTLAQVARELGVRADLLRKWKRQVEEGGGHLGAEVFPGPGKLPPQEEELRRLRREVETLRQERDFLKRAAAYFAQESK